MLVPSIEAFRYEALVAAKAPELAAAREAWNSDADFVSQITYQLEFRSHTDFMSRDLAHLGRLLLDRPQNMGIQSMSLYMTDAEVAEMQRRDALGDRIPLVVEAVTGVRESELPEGQEPDYGPNFVGIWGDQLDGGRIVLAVVDASVIPLSELQELVGGAENLKIVEWPFSFNEVATYMQMLVTELNALGIAYDVAATGTDEGRLIEVRVEDPESLPDGFGGGVPTGAFCVAQGPTTRPATG